MTQAWILDERMLACAASTDTWKKDAHNPSGKRTGDQKGNGELTGYGVLVMYRIH